MAEIKLTEIDNEETFDATPVMSNFLLIKNEINNQLNENNFSPSMNPTVNELTCDEYIGTNLIDSTGDITITLAKSQKLNVELATAPTTQYFVINEITKVITI